MANNLSGLGTEESLYSRVFAELQLLNDVTDDIKFEAVELPTLTSIGKSLKRDSASRPTKDFALLAVKAGLEEMADNYYQEAALEYFVIVNRLTQRKGVFVSKTDRRQAAANALGLDVSAEAMRKGSNPREDLILGELATWVTRLADTASSTADPEQGVEPPKARARELSQDSTSGATGGPLATGQGSPGRTRMLKPLAFGVVAAFALIGAFLLGSVKPWIPDGDQAAVSPSTVADETESSSETPRTTEVSPTAETSLAPAIASVQPDDEAISEPAIGPEPTARCAFAVGETEPGADATLLTAAAAIVAESGTTQCAEHPVEYNGHLYMQTLISEGRISGGVVAVPQDEGRSFGATALDYGEWQSYRDVANPLNPVRPGLPSGRVLETTNGWEMEVAGDVRMFSEAPDSKFFWTLSLVYDLWQSRGGAEGEFGMLMSNPILGGTTIDQDFEFGTLALTTATGTLEFTPGSPTQTFGSTEAGMLLSSRDFVGWYVGHDLKRWWVPDGQTWKCLGGDDNVLARQVPGVTIAALEFGGTAVCPATPEMGFPQQGAVDMALFCTDTLNLDNAELTDGLPLCNGPEAVPVSIKHSDICAWQYGERSLPVSDRGIWKCHGPAVGD